MSTSIPTLSQEKVHQLPQTGQHQNAAPKSSDTRVTQAFKDTRDGTNLPPPAQNRRITRSMSRAEQLFPKTLDQLYELFKKISWPLYEKCNKLHPHGSDGWLNAHDLYKQEKRQQLCEYFLKVPPSCVQLLVDSLDVAEFSRLWECDLDDFAAIFTQLNHQTGLEKAIAAKKIQKQLSRTKKIACQLTDRLNSPNLQKIKKWCDKGIDTSGRCKFFSDREENVISIALRQQKLAAAMILIKAGVNVNAADDAGEVPLHVASYPFSGNSSIIEALVQRGADVNFQDHERRTPLHAATLWDEIQKTQTLIRLGADLYKRDSTDRMAITRLSAETLCAAVVEAPGFVFDERFENAIKTNRISSELPYIAHVFRRSREVDNQNLRTFLEKLVIQRYTENWDPGVPVREVLSSRRTFRFGPDPENSDNVWVRTSQISQSMPKSRFYEIITQGISDENISLQIDGFFGLRVAHSPVLSHQEYSLTLHQAEFHEHPEKILATLNEQFIATKASLLRVHYEGEEGVDAGGLRRQFVCRLFAALCSKMQFEKCDNKLYRPKLRHASDGSFVSLTDEEKATYQHLGNLIMFCLNAAEHYPTGIVLDPGVLDAVRFSHKGTYTFDEQFEIFGRLAHYNEGDNQLLEKYERYLALADDETLHEVAAILAVDEDVATMKASLQKHILENIITPRLAPLHEIAVGMSASQFQDRVSFTQLQVMDLAKFSKRLQGVVSKQDIIDRLQFSSTAPEIVQTLLKEWIQKADEEKLQLFLFSLSGSTAIGDEVRITISNGSSIVFHTCSFQLDLDYDGIKSEQDLAERLDIALQAVKANPSFTAR